MASTDPAHPDAPHGSEHDTSFAALIPLGSHANAAPVEIKRPVTLIGSRKDVVRLHLQSSTVSKAHCAIILNSWGCYVHDLASRTGTLVNGKPVVDQDLADGDVIQVGRFQFKYRAPAKTRPKSIPLPPAELSVSTLTGPLSVHKRVLVIGRRAGADVQFEDSRVSNVHALIIEQDNRRLVRDLSSRSGTWLDDQPIHQEPLPDGADLKIGGAILRIADRATPASRAADAPLTLADAAPAAVVGLDALHDALDLEPLDEIAIGESTGGFRPDDTLPAADDDLASLRRNWKSPVRPAEPTLSPVAKSPAEPVEIDLARAEAAERSAEARRAEAEAEAEAEVDELDAPLELDLTDEAPAAEAAAPVAPAAPDTVSEVEPDAAPQPAAPQPAAPELNDEIELDELELDPDASTADGQAVDIEALAAEALAGPEHVAETSVAETPVTETPSPELPPVVPPAEAEVEADVQAEAVEPEPAEIEAERETPADALARDPDAPALVPSSAGELVETPVPADLFVPTDAVAIELAPAAEVTAEAPVDADAKAEPEPEALDLTPLDLSDISLELDADAPAEGVEAVADAVVLDPDAPAADAEKTVKKQAIGSKASLSDSAGPILSEASADVSDTSIAATAEIDAEIDVAEADLAEIDLTAEDDAAGIADTLSPVADAGSRIEKADTEAAEAESAVPWATPAEIDAEATRAGEADLVDLSADLKADELEEAERTKASEAASERATEAKAAEDATPADLIGEAAAPPTPEQAAAETVVSPTADAPSLSQPTFAVPAFDDLVIGRLSGGADDDEIADDLPVLLDEVPTADAPMDDAPADATPVAEAEPDKASSELGADESAIEELTAADTLVGSPADTLADATVSAVFVEPAETVIEPDRIRLADEAEDEDTVADTALAVDLGLVLDDEHTHEDHSGLAGLADPTTHGPVTHTPVPADPVDIDLSDARPVDRTDSIDLSHLGPAGDMPAYGTFISETPAGTSATDEHAAEDIFDVDDLELIEPPAAAAEFGGNESLTDDPFKQAAAEAKSPDEPKADDHIAPPSGGSLADLMPGGPPLLGGSFMSIPSIPAAPRPAGPGGKRRPPRVGFGQEPRGRPAPFAADRTIADAMGGVDADETVNDLLSAGGPSIDAFSGAPATTPGQGLGHPPANGSANGASANGSTHGGAGHLEAEEIDALPADTLLAPAERFRPRGVIRPAIPEMPAGDFTAGQSIAATPSAVGEVRAAAAPTFDHDPARVALHRRRVRRVIACLVAMLVLIGGAAWAVYTFMPIRSTVDALISFEGLDRLGTDEAIAFQTKQNDALVSEPVRQRAIQNLPPSVREPGFLADATSIFNAVDQNRKIRWPIEQPTAMRLRVRSADKEADVARVRALAEALVKTSDSTREQINQLKKEDQQLQGVMSQRRVLIGNLKDDLQALEQATVSRGNVKDRSALNAEYYAAEPALTAIKSKRQELEATIVRLKLPVGTATSAPTADPVASDEELSRLSKQLAELQQPAGRPEATAAGAEARKNLDAAIAQFQQDLASAQKLRDNPELAAYVEAANGMFTQFRQLTEGFIRRQEINRTRLSELKATLSDKQQARVQQLVETDAELKALKDNLGVLERQHNAAVAQGMMELTKKNDLEMRLMRAKIGEREDKFKNDTGFGEAITGIQSVIDQSEKESTIDRKNIDDRLTALQADFVKNAPAVEKLPAEQKALAEGIEKKLAAMNDARRAYDAAAEDAQQQAKASETAAAEKVAALRMQIAARRQDVLAAVKARQAEDDEATRKTRLAAAQTELDNVRQQEQAAQHRVADATAAIEQAEKQRRIDTQAESERQAKTAQRDAAERDLRTDQGRAAELAGKLAALIVPDPKIEWQTYDDVDRRPVIAGLAAGGIALLLLIPIIVDLLALTREHHPHAAAAADTGGFEPVLVETPEQKTLPEPASV